MSDIEFERQKAELNLDFERKKIEIQHEYNILKMNEEKAYKNRDMYFNNICENEKFAQNASKEYGIIFTRSMILINGGAIILSFNSLVNNASKNFNIDMNYFLFSFWTYVTGIIAATILAILGYYNFNYVANSNNNLILSSYFGIKIDEKETSKIEQVITYTYKLAFFIGIISIFCFIIGSYLAIKSIGVRL